MLIYIIFATLLQVAISFSGLVLTSWAKVLQKNTSYLISLSAGTFLGIVIFDLFPEVFEHLPAKQASFFVLVGILIFFVLSFVLAGYHHHHDEGEEEHDTLHPATGQMALVADFVHNFLDGIVIAGAFIVDVHLGIATTIAVAIHEFPQELSDFFVLLEAGFTRKRALLWNAIVSSTTVIGGVLGYFFLSHFERFEAPLIGIIAGAFLYLALSDLVPVLKSQVRKKETQAILQVILFILGILVMFLVSIFGGHA